MKKVFIERWPELLKIATIEEGKLISLSFEENINRPFLGEIYKGVVKNIVPAIKCAFVDIGLKKNCYMYLSSMYDNLNIKKGEEILVEVVKEKTENKAPKVINKISIPGRYVVLTTLNNDITFSKKIEDISLIKNIKKQIIKPLDIGVLVRTKAISVAAELINEEIEKLYQIYSEIKRKATYNVRPGLLYSDKGIIDQFLRNNLDDEIKEIIVDNSMDKVYMENYIKEYSNKDIKVTLYGKGRDLFINYDIESKILDLIKPKVVLPCKGYVSIEKTEAMHVIDVNSSKNTKENSIKDTAFITNLEGAKEIATQIKLRNLSGIILIDFIDLKEEKDKKEIIRELKKNLEGDKIKTVVYPFTELNLVQIARKRKEKSIYEYLMEKCSNCFGSGNNIKYSYLCRLIKNEIEYKDSEIGMKDIYIEINRYYKKTILNNKTEFLKDIDGLNRNIYVKFSNIEVFKVEPIIFKEGMQKEEIMNINDKDSLQM